MALSQDDIQRAEVGILQILGDSEGSFQPAQLIEQLADCGISEYSARVAIWYLIDRNLIELTMDRLLKSVQRDFEEVARHRPALAGG